MMNSPDVTMSDTNDESNLLITLPQSSPLGKRQRNNTDESAEEDNAAPDEEVIVRDKELYFNDADCVIQVERTLFRVCRAFVASCQGV